MGALLASAGTAAGAAGASTSLGTLATGLQVAGQVAGGIGGLQQGMFAAKVARRNAESTRMAGQAEESASRLKYGALKAEQKAAFAANGISVDSTSVDKTLASTQTISDMDAALIHYNAALKAYGYDQEAEMAKAAGRGALVSGLFGAAGSFLGG